MNSPLLKINLSKLEKEKIKLIKYWIGNIEVLTLLKRHNIDIGFFVKNFALGVIDYYFSVIEEKNEQSVPLLLLTTTDGIA